MSLEELTRLERARELVLERAQPLSVETVDLRGALDRTLAEDVVARQAVPGFDNSTMDGYALRAADTEAASTRAPLRLSLTSESRAGAPAHDPLGAGEAARISTGAAIPEGADAVIAIEESLPEDDGVSITGSVEAGRYVRRQGEDVLAGADLLPRGTNLGPAELGVLASQGIPSLQCYRRPRVMVLTSGDELLGPGEDPRPGGIYDATSFSVPALVERSGSEIGEVSSVSDGPLETKAAIAKALEADVTVICGGVSVGEHDHVKAALAELEVEQSFWGVALRPGKPTWFGTLGSTLVFGLPGNPVSSMVTFILFVRPALALLSGAEPSRARTTATLDADYEKAPGRAHAIRCGLTLREDGWHAKPAPRQASHILTSMLGADCLAIAPEEAGSINAGERLEVELIGHA